MGAWIDFLIAFGIGLLLLVDIVLRLLAGARFGSAAHVARTAPAQHEPEPPCPARDRERAALRRILRTVISESSRDDVLREIAAGVAGQLGAEWSAVLALGAQPRVLIQHGGAFAAAGTPVPIPPGRFADLLDAGTPQIFVGLEAENALPRELMPPRILRTVLVLPAAARDHAPCALVLADRREIPAPTAEEREIALGYADLAAMALEHSRLTGELEAKVRELTSLYEIAGYEMATITSSSPGIDDCLERTLDLVYRLMDLDACSIMLIDEASQELSVRAGRGKGPRPATTVRLRVGEGIAGRAAATGEPVSAEDVVGDPRFVPHPVGMSGGTSLLAVPMKEQNRVLGVINVRAAGGRRFAPDEVRTLQLVAGRTALAVANARATESLSLAHRMFATIVETLADGVVVVDRQGVIVHANAAVGAIAGLDVSHLICRSWHDLCRLRTRGGTRIESSGSPFGRLDLAEGESRCVEFEMLRPDGTTRYVDAHCAFVRDAEGQVLLGVASLRDATDRHEEDEARRQRLQCMVEDVRAPLLSASNTLEMLLGGQFGPLSDGQRKGITTSISKLRKVLICNGSLSRAATDNPLGNAATA